MKTEAIDDDALIGQLEPLLIGKKRSRSFDENDKPPSKRVILNKRLHGFSQDEFETAVKVLKRIAASPWMPEDPLFKPFIDLHKMLSRGKITGRGHKQRAKIESKLDQEKKNARHRLKKKQDVHLLGLTELVTTRRDQLAIVNSQVQQAMLKGPESMLALQEKSHVDDDSPPPEIKEVSENDKPH